MTGHIPGLDGLTESEYYWRDHYDWLKEQGYQLRPRFAPDWIPSWKGTGKYRVYCEDGHNLMYAQINDAVHVPTGSRVALKTVNSKYHPFEENIMSFLSSEPLLQDSRNHSVPLLDVLRPPLKEGDDDIHILVMPYLRPFNSPNFDTFGEAMECIRQLFEGLQFLHENYVAHSDLKFDNLMMDAAKMFPEGYHPMNLNLKPDFKGTAKFYTRTQRPPKYFIIDFGFSRQYDSSNTSPLEPTYVIGSDRRKTELQNPYQTDIYYLGELVRQEFLDGHPTLTEMRGYRGFDFLRPLIDDMIQVDPTKRPKIDDVVKRFEDIVNGFSAWKLRSRTSSRRSNIFRDVAHMFSHWTRKVTFVVKGTPAIPRV